MASDLKGKRIIVTREVSQAKVFSEKINANGGISIEIPLLQISCKKADNQMEIIRNMINYHWIIFTSANGVNCFFDILHSTGQPFSQTAKVAVVGQKTKEALNKFGYEADLMPDIYDADSLAQLFLPKYEKGEHILLIRGNRSLDLLPKRFKEKGIVFDSIEVYETTINEAIKETLNLVVSEGEFDYLTFTSPSTVAAFTKLYGNAINSPCVCIGTTTEKAARESGFSNVLTAETFTIEGMIEVMIQDQL